MVRFHSSYYPGAVFVDRGNHPTGHAIVATIAELHLDSTVLPALCSILNTTDSRTPCTLASVASWADTVRPQKPWSAAMHYVNADKEDDHPPQTCRFPGPKGWSGDKDVNLLGAIRNNTNILGRWVQEGSNLKDSIAADALRFLIHFVGDLHMPFHTVVRLRGANDIKVRWGTKIFSEYARLQLLVEYASKVEPLR